MRIHLIGVCGTAMATLAALLKHRGFDVQGSDQNVYPPMSGFLEREGIRTLSGYRADHVTADLDLVIVGNAISRGNPELEVVLDRKVRFCSLPEAVRDHFLWQRRSMVIAGTHGKTTTTALAGWVLTHAGRDPGLLVGGIAANFDASYRTGAGREFVIEGDEYDSAFFDKTAKFLKYLPDVAVVGNIEFDHADIYPDLDAVLLAFRRFVNLVPRSGLTLIGGDCPRASAMRQWAQSPVLTFGLGEGLDWRAVDLRPAAGGTDFEVRRAGDALRRRAPAHARRAQRAERAGRHRGGRARGRRRREDVVSGLAAFKGVKRRLELRGTASGVSVYDDFAHHPTAIARDAGGRAAGPPGRADLGHLRAAVGDLVPPRVPAGVHRGLRRRRRDGARRGVPVDAAGGGTAGRRSRRGRRQRARPPRAVRSHRAGDRRARRRAKRGPATSSSSCPTAGSTGSTTSCSPRSRPAQTAAARV